MRAEIIGIGTEILLGQIANTNAQVISERLAEIGIDVLHHQVVGDNVDRIEEAIRLGRSRAEVVILTGGLGPTGDDVTREGIARALGVRLQRRTEIEVYLRDRFRRLSREMPESNLVQADVPDGARYVLPDRGTAPGIVVEYDDGKLYAVPGVPAEMLEMLEGTILPELRKAVGDVTIRSRVLRTTAIPEAKVGELLADLFQQQTNPTVAFLAKAGEVRIRLTAKGGSEEEALALIEPLEHEVRSRLGAAVFGTDDDVLEVVVGRLLDARGLLLAVAESLTGGRLAGRITSAPGASRYFAGGVVAYSHEAKRDLLGVSKDTLEEHGAVSEVGALEMARGAAERFGADIAISTTGVAGPDEIEGEERGRVWVGLAAGNTE
ncbi:MAG: competence/damage-inducible protein A, partial [Actinomycetota bacterium]